MGGSFTRLLGRSPSSATIWKLISRSNNGGSFTTMIELQWLDSGGNAISTSGASHTASTAQAGAVDNLFDGDTGNIYQTATTEDAFVQTTFASPVAVAGVKIWGYYSAPDRCPGFFDVFYSIDGGSNFVHAFSGVKTSWPSVADTPITFQSPAATGSMAYWIVEPTALNGSTALTLSEAEFRTSVGGSDITSGGTAIVGYGTFSFGVVANLYDDNTGTLFSNNPWPKCSPFGYQFSSAQDIKQVGLRARSGGFLDQSPVSGYILAGSDGLCYVRRQSFSGLTWPADLTLNLINV
jgi:hypothetical protein